MSQLLDSFEVWSGGLPVGWTKHYDVSMAQSTSHVTQGTYSAHVSNGSRYLSMGHKDLVPALPAGKISVDVYVVSGAVQFSANSATYSVTSSGLGAQTLVLDVPVPVYSIGFIGTSLPGPDEFYADNIRTVTDVDVAIDTTTEFKLATNALNVLLDIMTYVPTTAGFELSYGTITAAPDAIVSVTDTLQFGLKSPEEISRSFYDWSSTPGADGLLTEDSFSDPLLVESLENLSFISDRVFSPLRADFTLSLTGDITVLADRVAEIPTTAFSLSPSAVKFWGDAIAKVPTPATFALAASGAGWDVWTGHHWDIENTLNFTLSLEDVEMYSELYREWVVMVSSPFDYEILGINVGAVEGEGRLFVMVDDAAITSDIFFGHDKTNVPISGIINRGQRLRVGIYMKNGYFRSFDATFALKRKQQ